ncbi:MAG TPA: von Willebrand factor type A domain-containing protein, partial [Candidatus Hydrogenedentes bacterium]|nr:von Willebrand factor type A domain-containing protein [Candidatus Hydrogenedentota bacterium]
MSEDKMMNEEKNDPRLTAYVLDELEPEERATFEASLESDPALRAALDEVSASAKLVNETLKNGDVPALLEAQRATIEQNAESGRNSRRTNYRRIFYVSALSAASIAFAVAFLTGGRTEKMPASESFQLSKGAESPKGVNLENLRDGRSIRELRSIPSNETNTKQLPATTTDGAAAQNWAEISESNALAQQGKPEEPGPIALQIQADPSIAEQIPHGVNEVTRFKTVDNPNTVTEETTALGIVVESEHGRPFLRQSREGVVDFFYDSQRPGEEHHWDTVPQGRLGDFYDLDFGRNNYAQMTENAFLQVAREPLSTFGLDVDTASYANVRRFLTSAQIPPPDAVRIEEFVNAFAYEYAAPSDGHSVAVSAEIAGCPWKAQHRLARIAVKAKDIPFEAQPPLRLTFLIDVSGSMENAKKLPLLKESMLALAKKLRATDQL